MIAVLVPVLGRPGRVAPLVESLEASSRVITCTPYFLVSPGDKDERAAVRASRSTCIDCSWQPERGDYARKMNHGVEQTEEPFIFFAADDLRFQPGWAERALAKWYESDCCVIGTNDLGNSRVTSGRHSTHTLVDRDYLECGTIDEEGRLLHEGYWHNFVDDEFVQTAIWRTTYASALDSIVEHLHPDWGKGAPDATYRKGREHFNDDRAYFKGRQHLWGGTGW